MRCANAPIQEVTGLLGDPCTGGLLYTWQNAIAITDATAPIVANTLDERIFCYFGLPEQAHTDKGAKFVYQLMT